MDRTGHLLVLVHILGSMSLSLSCFCDHYAWSSWSYCSKTCNYGTQNRQRAIVYDDYYWKNSCEQLCKKYESRACNSKACAIHCQVTDFGGWSKCSPCAKKQFRTRALERPAQFGGVDCSELLTDERPCHPREDCKMEPLNCHDKFKCANGRCINATLECNKQDDCGDRSDERDCGRFSTVCPVARREPPGSDLIGNGFDAMAETVRAAVLDNTLMGGECRTGKTYGSSYRLIYRLPANLESFETQVGIPDDFKLKPAPVRTEVVDLPRSFAKNPVTSGNNKGNSFLWIPIFYLGSDSHSGSHKKEFKETTQSSKTMDSQFYRVDQVLPVSKFKMKDSDLSLSGPFLEFLSSLPLEYNYALYRQIFQLFGTHYYASGSLGGHYDMLYQYNRETLTNSGLNEEARKGCLRDESEEKIIIYFSKSDTSTCNDDKKTVKHKGLFMQRSEKAISRVRGGRAGEAAALAWEKKGAGGGSSAYKNWAKSLIDNPTVVEYQLLPLIELVKDIPCAVTKRRHLRKALMEYVADFDSCKCAPCPNNARPALLGTECHCICQTGTYGSHCETRAKDFTSEVVDGYWSCWGGWSPCGAAMKKYRTRECNNPAPMRGGKACQGPKKQEERCFVSIFQDKDVCINDADFQKEGRAEGLPPGVEGCVRPKSPDNSYLRKDKRYYAFGEMEEFLCFTGFEGDGYRFFNCKPDGTWTESPGKCLIQVCFPPAMPEGISAFPGQDEYKVGQTFGLTCGEEGMVPSVRSHYKCGKGGRWDPPFPTGLQCIVDVPFVPDVQCERGQKLEGSTCVCHERKTCLPYKPAYCILNMDIGTTVMMSDCSFHAGRCHGDRLFFVNKGPCNEDAASLDWAKFRAEMSAKSSVQEPCASDTCYDWETCSETAKTCGCKHPRECPSDEDFCVKMAAVPVSRTMSLCTMGAIKCLRMPFEIVNEGPCE